MTIQTWALILDILLGAILLLCVVIGITRGFLQTLLRLAATVVAIVAAILITGFLEKPVTDLVYPYVQQPLQDFIRGIRLAGVEVTAEDFEVTDDGPSMTDEAYEQIFANEGISKAAELLRTFGLSEKHIRNLLVSLVYYFNQGAISGKEQLEQIAYTVLKAVVEVIVFLILFFLLRLILSFLTKSLSDTLSNVPVIGAINRIGGALWGAAEALCVFFILMFLLSSIGWSGYRKLIDASHFAKLLDQYNPIPVLFGN